MRLALLLLVAGCVSGTPAEPAACTHLVRDGGSVVIEPGVVATVCVVPVWADAAA